MDQMFTYAVEKCSEYLTISSAFYDMQSFVKKNSWAKTNCSVENDNA